MTPGEELAGHAYYDWADADDLVRHMREKHGYPDLSLGELVTVHQDSGRYRDWHRAAHLPEALAEARECIRACSGLGDHRWLTVGAACCPEDTGISLGTLRALAEAARKTARPSLTDSLVTLVREHRAPGEKELRCAPDVHQLLPGALGIQVTVLDHYAPGQWRLILHDHCSVIGGDTIDQAMIISHEDCTVVAAFAGTAACS